MVSWFGWFLWHNQPSLQAAKDISTSDTAALGMLIILGWLSTSSQNFVLFKLIKLRIGFFECFFLTLAATFGNYLPMRPGTLIRAHYMKNVHQLQYAEFASIFSVRFFLALLASGVCGLAAMLSLTSSIQNSLPLLLVFLTMICVPSLAYAWKQGGANPEPSHPGFWNKYIASIEMLKSRPSTTFICLALIILQLLFLSYRFEIAARVLGNDMGLAVVMILVSLANIANITAITPGGLGIRETLMGYATLVTGTNFTIGVMIGSVDRALLLIMTALLGGISFLRIWLNLNRDGTHPKPP